VKCLEFFGKKLVDQRYLSPVEQIPWICAVGRYAFFGMGKRLPIVDSQLQSQFAKICGLVFKSHHMRRDPAVQTSIALDVFNGDDAPVVDGFFQVIF